MTVESIYRILTDTHVVIRLTNGSMLYAGYDFGIPADLMDREVVITRVVDNRLIITVH